MRMSLNLLRVIFMLSTIVGLTDCCSSRILLLREHTLKIVYQHRIQQQEHTRLQNQQQALLDKLPQHADHRNLEMDYGKSHTSDHGPPSSAENRTTEYAINDRADQLNRSSDSFTLSAGVNNNVSDSDGHKTHNASSKSYDVFRLYTIIHNAFSLKCGGIFLTDFCLNKGSCFIYPVANYTFFACKCAKGYVGERCEFKSLIDDNNATATQDVDISLTRPKPQILKARFVFSFPMLITISVIYLIFGAIVVFKCPQHKQRTAGMFES